MRNHKISCVITILIFCATEQVCSLLLESEACGLFKLIPHSGALFGPDPQEAVITERPLFFLTGKQTGSNDIPIFLNIAEASMEVEEGTKTVQRAVSEKETKHSLFIGTAVSNRLVSVFRWFQWYNTNMPTLIEAQRGQKKEQSGQTDNRVFLDFACEPLKTQDLKGKIVIAARGDCFFYDKAIHAEAAGASGLIVVNNRGEHPVRMQKPVEYSEPLRDPKIPTVLISWDDFYQNFLPCYQNGMEMFASIDARGAKSPHFDSNEALNWAMLKAMFFWIIFQFMVNVFRYRRQTRNLSKRLSAVQALPEYIYHETKEGSIHTQMNRRLCIHINSENILEGDDAVCAICLDHLMEDQVVRKFQCYHIFHKECIDPWLLQSSLCPTCKRNIVGLPITNSSRPSVTETEFAVRLDD
eukprot:jgi/Galph1/5608/GphlegSOOS_G4253.1